ncbi:unnamed protein product [Pieris macdunnoughi]|uniref:Uncharacterized protein n=1 Tax=Pieris macdunnoughi TaxID=345717 RepID=A0A821P5G7_9NEOP|nr:unnamed protein product [Pieris macdunnoughi]
MTKHDISFKIIRDAFSIYISETGDNDILQELLRVLGTGRGSVKKWSIAAECLVETGCDAIWKLSKDFCKKLRFPCVAYVTITSVFLKI